MNQIARQIGNPRGLGFVFCVGMDVSEELVGAIHALTDLDAPSQAKLAAVLVATPPSVDWIRFRDHIASHASVSEAVTAHVIGLALALIHDSRSELDAVVLFLAERFTLASDTSSCLVTMGRARNALLSFKASDLSTCHENPIQGVRVVSDIRPIVLNEDETPDHVVITHALHLLHGDSSSGGQKKLVVGLETDDLKQVVEALQRAVRKQHAWEKMCADAGWKVLSRPYPDRSTPDERVATNTEDNPA